MRAHTCGLVLVLVAAIGCGGGGRGRLIAPSAHAALSANEGLLIVAAESDRVRLRYCLDGVPSACAELGPTPAHGSTLVYGVAAGRYCLLHVACEPTPGAVTAHDVPEDEALCVEVTRDQIAYPGHLHFDRAIAAQTACAGRATFLLHHDIDHEIDVAHPGLLSPHVTLSPTTTMGAPR